MRLHTRGGGGNIHSQNNAQNDTQLSQNNKIDSINSTNQSIQNNADSIKQNKITESNFNNTNLDSINSIDSTNQNTESNHNAQNKITESNSNNTTLDSINTKQNSKLDSINTQNITESNRNSQHKNADSINTTQTTQNNKLNSINHNTQHNADSINQNKITESNPNNIKLDSINSINKITESSRASQNKITESNPNNIKLDSIKTTQNNKLDSINSTNQNTESSRASQNKVIESKQTNLDSIKQNSKNNTNLDSINPKNKNADSINATQNTQNNKLDSINPTNQNAQNNADSINQHKITESKLIDSKIFRYMPRFIFVNFALLFCVYIVAYVLMYLRFKDSKNAFRICANTLSAILFIFIFTFSFVDIFLIINFYTTINPVFFDTFLTTNVNEANEFLHMYLDSKSVKALSCFVVFSFLFLIMPIRKVTNIKINRVFKEILFIFCALYLLIHQSRSAEYLESKCVLYRYSTIIFDAIKNVNLSISQYNSLRKEMQNFLDSQKGYKITPKSPLPKNVVLIIGESTQRNYMQLYNFTLPTNPLLSPLVDSKNLFVFSDVIAPHSHTNEALRKVLTFQNYENEQTAWYHQHNIIDIMKGAKFKTFWLTNQESISIYGSVTEVISRLSDVYHTSMVSHSLHSGFYPDGVLLPILDKYLQDSIESNFYVLHLMGTHGGYENRYPKEYAFFNHANFPTLNAQDDSKAQIKATYTNAVLYNDYVMREIIKRFENTESIVIYLSDHADEVYDFRDFYGHTESIGSRFMVEIPFMIFLSNKAKEKFPHLESKITNALNKPFMSDDFIHALLDLLDINTPDFDSTRSIFSSDFNDKRKRIYANRDYDAELKKQKCLYCDTLSGDSKIWLHHVDEIQKLVDYYGLYENFEIDVHFLYKDSIESRLYNTKEPHTKGYFDVGHDGIPYSIDLNLDSMIATLASLSGDSINKHKIWLDFKNLNAENRLDALNALEKICKKYGFLRSNVIVESSDYKSLKVFKNAGFYTSYPYYTLDELDSNALEIKSYLQNIANSGAVNALSFAYYLYDFMESLDLNIDYLTWNEANNKTQNLQIKAFTNPQVKVILSGEHGFDKSHIYR